MTEPIERYLERFGDWLIEEGFDRPARDLPDLIVAEIDRLRAANATLTEACREISAVDEGEYYAQQEHDSRHKKLRDLCSEIDRLRVANAELVRVGKELVRFAKLKSLRKGFRYLANLANEVRDMESVIAAVEASFASSPSGSGSAVEVVPLDVPSREPAPPR